MNLKVLPPTSNSFPASGSNRAKATLASTALALFFLAFCKHRSHLFYRHQTKIIHNRKGISSQIPDFHSPSLSFTQTFLALTQTSREEGGVLEYLHLSATTKGKGTGLFPQNDQTSLFQLSAVRKQKRYGKVRDWNWGGWGKVQWLTTKSSRIARLALSHLVGKFDPPTGKKTLERSRKPGRRRAGNAVTGGEHGPGTGGLFTALLCTRKGCERTTQRRRAPPGQSGPISSRLPLRACSRDQGHSRASGRGAEGRRGLRAVSPARAAAVHEDAWRRLPRSV